MDNKLYDMIFKRKSFHLFRNIGNEHITDEEIKDIENKFEKMNHLGAEPSIVHQTIDSL